MSGLAEVLEFKFPGVQGIQTRERVAHPEPFDPFRDMEIVDWPEATTGRPQPTPAELATWRTEFEGLPIEKPPMDAEDVWEVLKTKGVVTDADVPADRRQPLPRIT